jgi:RND family efflux transporter MFP subunit
MFAEGGDNDADTTPTRHRRRHGTDTTRRVASWFSMMTLIPMMDSLSTRFLRRGRFRLHHAVRFSTRALPTHAVRRFVGVGAVVGGLLALLVGCAPSTADEPAAPAATPVRVDTARARTAPLPIRASGRLASKAEITLSFKIDGVVDRIRVDEGDAVREGQTLARLHLSEIEASVMEAESALDKARRDLERTQRLHRDSVATLEEVQDAQTAVDVAEARLQAARFNRAYAVIEAPASGRILRRHAEDGELVRPGQPVLTLGASARGWVLRVGLSASDVVPLQLGDSARVQLNAYPSRTFPARVTEIADASTPGTGTFDVELTVDPQGATFKSGFIGAAALYPSAPASYVEVPITALVRGAGHEGTVFALDRGRAQRHTVRIARLLDSTLVLSGGLPPGTPVITDGSTALRDGDAVRRIEVEGSKVGRLKVRGAQSSRDSR